MPHTCSRVAFIIHYTKKALPLEVQLDNKTTL